MKDYKSKKFINKSRIIKSEWAKPEENNNIFRKIIFVILKDKHDNNWVNLIEYF